jgi:hypothetical protein
MHNPEFRESLNDDPEMRERILQQVLGRRN